LDKSFGRAFSKARAVEGAEPSSPSADGEKSFSPFSFVHSLCECGGAKRSLSFFFCAFGFKRKATKVLARSNELRTFDLQLAAPRKQKAFGGRGYGCFVYAIKKKSD
jgi:hypothetical protein